MVKHGIALAVLVGATTSLPAFCDVIIPGMDAKNYNKVHRGTPPWVLEAARQQQKAKTEAAVDTKVTKQTKAEAKATAKAASKAAKEAAKASKETTKTATALKKK